MKTIEMKKNNNYKVARRVINIHIDGLSPELLFEISSNRKLKNFEFLMRNGSWGKLKSFKPVFKLSHLASYLTGEYPFDHGFTSFLKYTIRNTKIKTFLLVPKLFPFFILEEINIVDKIYLYDTSSILRLFHKYEEYGIENLKKVDFFENFYATVVSENKYFLIEIPPAFEDISHERKNHEEKALYYAIVKDTITFHALLDSLNKKNIQFFFFYFDGLLEVEKIFLRYKYPEIFYDINEDKIIRFGNVIDNYYEFIDANIGKVLALMQKDDLLIISSSFGIAMINPFLEALKLSKKSKNFSGTYNSAPEGVILFYGSPINRDNVIKGFRIRDAFPVIIYYLGCPFKEKLIKKFSFDMFKKEFLRENPLIFTEEE